MYSVELTKKAVKFLKGVPRRDYDLIMGQVEQLETNLFPAGYKQLKGYDKVFRLRAGNYRIIYVVDNGKLIVTVIDIGDRKDIY